jgi:uncharacterized protein (DUF433 family)
MEEITKYISIHPDIRFGKPCVKGTRIAVVDILQWLASGMTYEEILADYPSLNIEQIKAALAFAARRESITKYSAAWYMKLLIDANISWRLCALISEYFPGLVHVDDVKLS